MLPRREDRERLVRIETKLDQFTLDLSDHELRLRTQEQHSASPLRVYAVPITMLSSIGAFIVATLAILGHL